MPEKSQLILLKFSKKNRKVFWFWATLSILLLEKIIHHKAILENAI